MIFDLVARATLNERYGLQSKPLRPFRDYADLECRGEDPRALRSQGLLSVRQPVRRMPAVVDETFGSSETPSRVEFATAAPD